VKKKGQLGHLLEKEKRGEGERDDKRRKNKPTSTTRIRGGGKNLRRKLFVVERDKGKEVPKFLSENKKERIS